jgi:hypothetical protein
LQDGRFEQVRPSDEPAEPEHAGGDPPVVLRVQTVVDPALGEAAPADHSIVDDAADPQLDPQQSPPELVPSESAPRRFPAAAATLRAAEPGDVHGQFVPEQEPELGRTGSDAVSAKDARSQLVGFEHTIDGHGIEYFSRSQFRQLYVVRVQCRWSCGGKYSWCRCGSLFNQFVL